MAYDVGPISEEEWAQLRRESMQALPIAFDGLTLPEILFGYQKEILQATSAYQLVATDKSRRIGATWGVGADAVLTAGAARTAGGMDVLYIGYNLDMAREFIDVCAMWAKAFMPACTEVAEFLFKETDEHGADKSIQAFRIAFASGFEIVALSSRPRSLRGRQGYVILDEFAFHDDAQALLKAAMALLIWGGKVLVISTHNGVDNPFNELLNEIRSKKRPGKVVRCTFDDAIQAGLYVRVCMKRGIEWSAEGEAAWRAEIYKFYGADAAEELECVPAQGSGVYLTRALIEACSRPDIPVLRLHCPPGFELKPEFQRRSYVDAWLEQSVAPEIAKLDKNLAHCLGQDFARSGDVSGLVPLAIERNLTRRAPFVIEMRNVPYEQQKQVFFYVADHLPRFIGAKLDATGNGGYLGEVVQQKYGIDRIEAVKISQLTYLEYMPPMKAAFEDRTIVIPAHVDVVDDLRQIKLIRGIPMVPSDAHTKGADGLNRHGDFAVAFCLAYAASRLPPTDFSYRPVARATAMERREAAAANAADEQAGPGRMRDRPGDRPAASTSLRAAFRREGTFG
jgi:phage FluMu gp28-like protein